MKYDTNPNFMHCYREISEIYHTFCIKFDPQKNGKLNDPAADPSPPKIGLFQNENHFYDQGLWWMSLVGRVFETSP